MPMQEVTVTITYQRKPLWRRLQDLSHVFLPNWRWMRKEGADWLLSLCGAWILSGYVIKVGA